MHHTREQILAELSALVRRMTRSQDLELTETTALVSDIGVDSVMVMEIIASLEERFQTSIPDSDLMSARLVGDVLDVIERRLSARVS